MSMKTAHSAQTSHKLRRWPSRWKPAVLATALLACLAVPATGQDLSPVERGIAARVAEAEAEMIELLREVVDVNSGTMNSAGVREVGRIFAERLGRIGFETRWIDLPDSVDRAGHLLAVRPGEPGGARLLLIGHLDTVFEPGDPFQRFERQDTLAAGPGVVDMKGGDVVIVHALEALHAEDAFAGATVTVALIGDEESAGLPLEASRGDLIAAGQAADAALGFEGGDPGRAVIARRGSSGWSLRTTGRQGHSSGIFSESAGSGAVFEAARILHRFHEELRGPRYLTFNAGVVLGGTDVEYDAGANQGTAFGKTNVIPRTVVVAGGLRFITHEQLEDARAKMREIVARSLPVTSAEIEFTDKYPAMPPTEGNRRLLEVLDGVSRALGHGGVEPYDPGDRGAADVSFVAPYVAAIDGLGVYGSGSHTPGETVDLRSLVPATQRAAILIHRLARERSR